ncbi:EP300-interacting inhibitor of differentiation 1 [Pteronotus mesoamericanus]|uniref:EP300-interacting inhibitor of differentiation 1 n=1 Tax=Pteronotus mesoamericanus TaxID=1884717 RepID=UPI0023EAACDD|nr:EP300-interacting inhibitor of differentiation 1 [Pteronotus parnellii mesoamericanus]
MLEMHELSQLYEESNDLQMGVIHGESDLPQMEVGRASREPSPNPSRNRAQLQLKEDGPMEEEGAEPVAGPEGDRGLAKRPSPGEQPGQAEGLDLEIEGEQFDDWEDDYDYPEEERLSGSGYRVPEALEEVKMFLRTSRAREAALDGGFQRHYEKTPFDQLAFIEELFSLMVVNRLTEELGCDEIIDRE